MKKFGQIRIPALKHWNKGLGRERNKGEFFDDYSLSEWCKIQNECIDKKMHCSFICSLGDWLDNVSDLLHDKRFDNLKEDDYEILFRFYTKILLVISEIIEDFIMLNKEILGFNDKTGKKLASRDLEQGVFSPEELKHFSNFVNSVCKHKAENNNLHVHNHHLKIEFKDFGAGEHENQIRLNNQKWEVIDEETSILMPELIYFIELVIKTNNKILNYLHDRNGYKKRMFEIYTDNWQSIYD